jgi:oligosaccharide repeat unit polymerase
LFIIGGLNDQFYLRLLNHDPLFLFNIIIGVSFLFLGFKASKHDQSEIRLGDEKFNELKKPLILSTVFLLLLTIVLYLKISRLGLGVAEYILSGFLSEYIQNYLSQDSTIENLIGVISLPLSLYPIILVERLIRKGYNLRAILATLLFQILPIFFTTSTRLRILLCLILPVLYWHLYTGRIGWVKSTALAVFVLSLLVLLNTARSGLGNLSSFSIEDALFTLSADLSPLYGLTSLYVAINTGKIGFEYGADIIYFIVSVIPRYFWEGKPLTGFEPRLTVETIGEISPEFGVLTFTLFGYGYAQFGIFGTALASFVYGYLIKYTKSKILNAYHSKLAALYFSIYLVIGLRSSLQFLIFMTMIYLAYPFLESIFKRTKA